MRLEGGRLVLFLGGGLEIFLMVGEDFFFFCERGAYTHRIGREGRGKER